MDWYLGNDMEDLVVPKYQELADSLPSPQSWSKWGLIGNFESSDECFVAGAYLTHDKPKFNGKLCNDAEFESAAADVKDPFGFSSICRGLSEESLNQTPLSQPQTDDQLDDFVRFEQLDDDIFLSSVLEDLPWSEDLHKSFCFSPEYECEAMLVDYLPTDISANGFVSEGTSLEESVLRELEVVMTQFSDKTRICFRDAFYRLAKNSKLNPVALNQQGNLNVQNHSPKWTISEEKMRSGKKETTESETNTIDRTIANLTFNKMQINVRDFPVTTPDNSKQNVIRVTGQPDQCLSH